MTVKELIEILNGLNEDAIVAIDRSLNHTPYVTGHTYTSRNNRLTLVNYELCSCNTDEL